MSEEAKKSEPASGNITDTDRVPPQSVESDSAAKMSETSMVSKFIAIERDGSLDTGGMTVEELMSTLDELKQLNCVKD